MADDRNSNPGKTEETDVDRRKFIKNTGLVAGGVVGGSLLGGFFGNQFGSENDDKDSKNKKEGGKTYRDARQFFTRKQDFDVIVASSERIYPKDDNGPGAIELGVPYFIDSQLAGEYGLNAKAYTSGPFKDTDSTERYQSRMTRGDIMIQGVRAVNDYSDKKYKAKFADLKGEDQDKVLTEFETNKIKMNGVSSEVFFNLLRQMTIEGCYCDPLYGGNRDMQGWKMREFPGAHPAYINDIDSEKFVKMDPISLKDYQP